MNINKRKTSIIGSDRWTITLDMEAATEALLKEHVPEQFRDKAAIEYISEYDELTVKITYDDYENPSQY